MTIEAPEAPVKLGEPVLRWSAKASSIAEIEGQLSRIWASEELTTGDDGAPSHLVSARTSVMNLIVVARRPELAERSAATIQMLTGRHPSRTIVIQSADPDGPSWLDARVEAHCIQARLDSAETCAETVHVICGGEAGRHLAAIATPLIIHDLPVTVWWPGEPSLRDRSAKDLLAGADRLIVDGSTWSGDGLDRLRDMAGLLESTTLAISDFAHVRQSRWREAIASIFDDPEFMPFLRSLRRIAVTYSTHDETGAPGSTNLVKPVYHVGWLSSRLDLSVVKALAPVGGGARGAATAASRGPRAGAAGGKPVIGRGLVATLSDGRAEVGVVVRPVVSTTPAGTTLRVELLAERRGSELRADVTAEAETVRVRVWLDGVEAQDRLFRAPRRGRGRPARGGDRIRASRSRLRRVAGGRRAPDRPEGRDTVTEPEIVTAADADAAADDAARWIATTLEAAVQARGSAHWATTGGSTPVGIYRRLVAPPLRDAVTWDAVHVWWGDDRYVPRDHPFSNVKAFDDVMLAIGTMEEGTAGKPYPGVPLPAGNVHPFPTTEAIGHARGAAWCAATYADELREARLPEVDGWPSFDLLFLGVGGDGHLLSVFADSPALDSPELGLGDPGTDPYRAARRAGHAQSGDRRRGAAVAGRRPGWRQGSGDRGDLRARA